MHEKLKLLVMQFSKEWALAEEYCKATEGIRNEVHYASVQELRYAGRRFVFAISAGLFEAADETSKQFSDARTDLIEAIENCKKARHDAIDSAIMFVHGELQITVKDFGTARVVQYFPEFLDLHTEIAKIRKMIAESRGRLGDRDKTYFQIKTDHIGRLKDFHDKLIVSDTVLSDIAENDARRERRQRIYRFIAIWLLPIGSMLVGVLASLWPDVFRDIFAYLGSFLRGAF